jgi:hypothetical protein
MIPTYSYVSYFIIKIGINKDLINSNNVIRCITIDFF